MPDDLSKRDLPANPGPYIALPTVEDAEDMKRALRGVTTSRAAGIAHQTAERELAKGKPKDMPFMTHTRHRVMAGRRHPDQIDDLNAGLNVGSTHLMMPAEPHGPKHRKAPPVEGQVTLPKDA